MNKDDLGIHRIIVYLYLPLSVALNIYLAAGNVFDIGRLKFTSVLSVFEAVDLFLPFVTVVLYTLSLIGLLSMSSFGLKTILLSTTIRIYTMLFLIVGCIMNSDYLFALHFLSLSLIAYLIHGYYRKKAEYFK